MRKKLILVHGLGGDGRKTWEKFQHLLSEDLDVDCDVSTFEYPTKIFSFMKATAAIHELADGLRTFVRTRCKTDDEVLFVGHSLGGLVIRKYLLTEFHAGRKLPAKKVLLYATPNQGSALANVARLASWRNSHLRQLGKDSDFLDDLNDQWVVSRIDDHLLVWLVWSTDDGVVPRESAKSVFRGERVYTVHGKSHKNIIRPEGMTDDSYLLFKEWLKLERSISSVVPDGAHKYEEWVARESANEFPFCPDEARESAISQLQKLLRESRQVARIVGLSGLGKTRLALEVFRYGLSDGGLAEQCLYIDAAAVPEEVHGLVAKWVRAHESGILVVDNCDLRRHQILAAEVRRADSALSLLTIDYNLDQSSESAFIFKIGPMSESHIKSMLAPVYGDRIPDLDRIVDFAQGFPQMAVLLAKARLDQDPNLGRLNDDILARKLLWGDQNADSEVEKILSACALFDHFGITRERAAHAEFIAKELLGIDFGVLYSCVQKFSERGIIDRRGDFGKIVPRPLAIRLAAQWWRNTPTDRQVQIIQSDMPEKLTESFCEQIARLDFLPEVKALTEKLCGRQGPFGQAEVILSVRGSLLFRSLVEVNPSATSAALYRVLDAMSVSEVRCGIVDEVRRNLVWALEKLCFHTEVFEEAAWCLSMLAIAENESWANNATGQFTQLFRVFLSGTAAPPERRFLVIDRLIASGVDGARLLAIGALAEAASPRGGSRTVGAEYQGTAPPLEEWRPVVWGEAFAVWEAALTRLARLTKDEACAAAAKGAIASNIRPLMSAGRHETLDSAIREVVDSQGPLWPEAMQAIRDIYAFDAKVIPPEGAAALQRWIDLLTPTDLSDRLVLYVSKAPYDHRISGDDEAKIRDREDFSELIEELSHNSASISQAAPLLVTGEQRKGFQFGQEFVRMSGSAEPLLTATVNALRQSDSPNPAVFLGLLAGLSETRASEWNRAVLALANDAFMIRYFFDAATTGRIDKQILDCGLAAIKDGTLGASAATALTFGRVLDSLGQEEVCGFCDQLARVSDEGAWVALEVLAMYCYGSEDKFAACAAEFKELVTLANFNAGRTGRGEMQGHHWKEVAERLLKLDSNDMAGIIAAKVLSAYREKASYSDAYHYLHPVLARLLTHYSSVTWPLVREAVDKCDPAERFRLSMLFGEREGRKESGRLMDLVPVSDLMEWCKARPDVAPKFVASTISVWHQDDDGEWVLTTRATHLLDLYGGDGEVGGHLSGNVDTGSWVGSLVPKLEKELAALGALAQHQSLGVRAWAVRRSRYLSEFKEDEVKRDEEHEWGIF